jgi:hypothetical protein
LSPIFLRMMVPGARDKSFLIPSKSTTAHKRTDTFKAALRWEGAIGGKSRVSNSAVHGSKAWLTSVFKSNNVELTSSTFVGARAIGMHSDYVRNYKLTNNFIGDVSDRIFSGVKVVDK